MSSWSVVSGDRGRGVDGLGGRVRGRQVHQRERRLGRVTVRCCAAVARRTSARITVSSTRTGRRALPIDEHAPAPPSAQRSIRDRRRCRWSGAMPSRRPRWLSAEGIACLLPFGDDDREAGRGLFVHLLGERRRGGASVAVGVGSRFGRHCPVLGARLGAHPPNAGSRRTLATAVPSPCSSTPLLTGRASRAADPPVPTVTNIGPAAPGVGTPPSRRAAARRQPLLHRAACTRRTRRRLARTLARPRPGHRLPPAHRHDRCCRARPDLTGPRNEVRNVHEPVRPADEPRRAHRCPGWPRR